MPIHHERAGGSRRWSASLTAAVCLAPLVLTAGCAAFPSLTTTSAARSSDQDSSVNNAESAAMDAAVGGLVRQPERLTILDKAPQYLAVSPPLRRKSQRCCRTSLWTRPWRPRTIPQFAATVFGGVLNTPYSLSGDVATRTEMIAGGTGGVISKRALFRLTQQALKQYGIDVYIDGGSVTVGSSTTQAIGATLERSRTSPATSGRVVQFFNVQTIEVNVLQSLLSDLFPGLGGARITPDPLSNSLIISGSANEVAQVVRVLREIDQPRFAGANALRIEPIYWSADALAASLEQTLTTEGYIVSRQALAGRSIVILSFPQANQILVFAKDQELVDRVNYWVNA